MKPDTFQTVKFLQALHAKTGAYPTISAIYLDENGKEIKIETKAFPESDWPAIFKWLNDRNGKTNLYFQVNQSRAPKDNKASKKDIAALLALHVDVDVRVGEDQEAGIKRIVATFDKYKVQPTFIISSGGGAQAFW